MLTHIFKVENIFNTDILILRTLIVTAIIKTYYVYTYQLFTVNTTLEQTRRIRFHFSWNCTIIFRTLKCFFRFFQLSYNNNFIKMA